jgi:hypothetical protein
MRSINRLQALFYEIYLIIICWARLIENSGLNDFGGDDVGIDVGRRSSILKVALLVFLGFARNAHRGAAIGDAVGERIDRCRLVLASQSQMIVGAIHIDTTPK